MDIPQLVVGDPNNKWNALACEISSYYKALCDNGLLEDVALVILLNYVDKLHDSMMEYVEMARANEQQD